MHVWTETKTGADGNRYEVRYLMTELEARQLQSAGLVGELWRVEAMIKVADAVIAGLQRSLHDEVLH